MGAGPAGLFAAFQLGLFNISSIIVDSQPEIGGQCAAFYSDKPVFDAPGFVSILAGDLVKRLEEQMTGAHPEIILGNRVIEIERASGGTDFSSILADGRSVSSRTIILATGGGALDVLPMLGKQAFDDVLNVDPSTFGTDLDGIFAIGDAANYPGKLRLILSAFHEAALATQAIRATLSDNAKPPRGRAARQRSR